MSGDRLLVKYAASRVTTTSLMNEGAVVNVNATTGSPVFQVVDRGLAGGPAGHPQQAMTHIGLQADRGRHDRGGDEDLARAGSQVAACDAAVGQRPCVERVAGTDRHAFTGEPLRQVDGALARAVIVPALTAPAAVAGTKTAATIATTVHPSAWVLLTLTPRTATIYLLDLALLRPVDSARCCPSAATVGVVELHVTGRTSGGRRSVMLIVSVEHGVG